MPWLWHCTVFCQRRLLLGKITGEAIDDFKMVDSTKEAGHHETGVEWGGKYFVFEDRIKDMRKLKDRSNSETVGHAWDDALKEANALKIVSNKLKSKDSGNELDDPLAQTIGGTKPKRMHFTVKVSDFAAMKHL